MRKQEEDLHLMVMRDEEYLRLQHLFHIAPEVARDKLNKSIFRLGTAWENQPAVVAYSPDHSLYPYIFSLYAIASYEERRNEHFDALVKEALADLERIIDLASSMQFTKLDENEQIRWDFLAKTLSHLHPKLVNLQHQSAEIFKSKIISFLELLLAHLPANYHTLRFSFRELVRELSGEELAFMQLNKLLCHLRFTKKDLVSTLEWVNNKYTVEFHYQHPLYLEIFDIYLLSKYMGGQREAAKIIASSAYANLQRINDYLQSSPLTKHKNDEKEEYRWCFIMLCLAHCIGKIYYAKLGDTRAFHALCLTLIDRISPQLKPQQRILKRHIKILSLDLDTIIGSCCVDEGLTDLAEDYFHRALRKCGKYLINDESNRFDSFYVISHSLSLAHWQRQDYLAAEIQYDHAVRFISKTTCVGGLSREADKGAKIMYFDLAAHYKKIGSWEDEKRLLTKTRDTCERMLNTVQYCMEKSDMQESVEAIYRKAKMSLWLGCFFQEMPGIVLNQLKELNRDRLQLIAQSNEAYRLFYQLLSQQQMLIPNLCSEEKLVLQLKLSTDFDWQKFFQQASDKLTKTKEKKGTSQLAPKKPVAAVARPVPESNFEPAIQIPGIFSWHQHVKRSTGKAKRSNKMVAASAPTENRFHLFAVTQRRAAPLQQEWDDEVCGKLRFPHAEEESQLIILRNDFNCGKPTFGYINIALLRVAFANHYKDTQVDAILKVLINTFNEGKQAGFFGRGIKSCPNLPLLKGTPYCVELKPSSGFDNPFRLYGRRIHNGEHTLYIFDAIDIHPKSAASKLEILRQGYQPVSHAH